MFIEFRDTTLSKSWRYFSLREGHGLGFTLESADGQRFDRTIPWVHIPETRRMKLRELQKEVLRLVEEIRQSL